MTNKLTAKQATYLGRRLHWTKGLLAKWAQVYIDQCMEEKSLTSIEASSLIDDLLFLETQPYGWQYEEAGKAERENRLSSVHKILQTKYNADTRVNCSVCERKADTWTEKGAYIVCYACKENLLNETK
jgi:hypothetical protein